MPHNQYFHKPTVIKDLIIITVFNLTMLIVFLNCDVLETIYQLSRKYESFELDELIPLGISIALSLLVFSYRRIKELGRMAQTLEHLSLIDPLTNLPNRRAGQIKVMSWCRTAEKAQKTFAVFQIDIDNFKEVNSLYGESVGDEVLVLASKIITENLPEIAYLYRWLDDNFIVVWPTSTVILPFDVAEKIQQGINGHIMPSTLSLTCSIGFSIREVGQSPEDLLYNVEDALIQAKKSGKNKIKVA
jgi:diguanylate cyclase (GGDEF)-like protein